MTDITDKDRRLAREWATMTGKQPGCFPSKRAAARVILATVDDPPKSLAEEVKEAMLFRVNDTDAEGCRHAIDLSDRVEALERGRDHWKSKYDEARAEVKRERDLGDALAHERDDTRAELERVRDAVDPKGAGLPPGMTISGAVQTLVDGIPTGERVGLTDAQLKREYDLIEARAEVDRLEAAQETHARMYREARDELAEVTHARDSLREDYDHARAEVERLTAEDKRKDKAAAEGVEILLRKNGDLTNTIARLVTTSNIINNGGRITYTEKDGKPVQESDTTTWKADE